MKRPLSWLLALVSLGLLALGLAWPLELAYERGRVFARGSSLRSDAEGTRALFLLLAETGAAPQRLTRPAPEAERGLLLAIAPEPRPAGVQAELLAWVERGNTLVLAAGATSAAPRPRAEPTPTATPGDKDQDKKDADDGATPADRRRRRPQRAPAAVVQSLEAALGLTLTDDASGGVPASAPEGSPLAALLAGEPEPRAARAFRAWPQRARVLLGTRQAPVLLELAWGGGRVLALSDASWLTNAGLPQGARLRVARHLVSPPPGGVLLFDEYRHGLAESPGLAYVLARYGLLPAAFALLLFLGLVAWATTPAEAPPSLPEDEAGEVRDSLVETRAGLYARTLRPTDALDLLERDLRGGLSARLRRREAGDDAGAAGRLSWKDARRLLRERRPQSGPRVQQLLDEIERARRRPPQGLRPLLPLARRIARFLQEVR